MNKWFLIFLFCQISTSYAQTCCSGGVPVSGTLGIGKGGNNGLSLALQSDFINLNRLYQNKERLKNLDRKRMTYSQILQMAYVFKDHWGVEVLLPYLLQTRISGISQSSIEKSSGLGDVISMINYYRSDQINLNIALGAKWPTGGSQHLSSDGIILNPDMQTGSGSTDLIGRVQMSMPLTFRKSIAAYLNSVYFLKNSSKGLSFGVPFKFGNEYLAELGVSDQNFAFQQLWQLNASMQYRWISPNIQNNEIISVTGGQWLNAVGNISLLIPSKNMQVSTMLTLPVITHVNGLQNAPNYKLTFGLIKTFQKHNNSNLKSNTIGK